MTPRQRALHLRLRKAAPSLYLEAERELAKWPVGHSVVMRLPMRFEPLGQTAIRCVASAILVTKTQRGLEYVDLCWQKKGWSRPRPRLLPMVGEGKDLRQAEGSA